MLLFGTVVVAFTSTRKKHEWLNIAGEESSDCTEGDSEASSSDKRTERPEASEHDHEMHAVAAARAGACA